jgi:hypothetical protein
MTDRLTTPPPPSTAPIWRLTSNVPHWVLVISWWVDVLMCWHGDMVHCVLICCHVDVLCVDMAMTALVCCWCVGVDKLRCWCAVLSGVDCWFTDDCVEVHVGRLTTVLMCWWLCWCVDDCVNVMTRCWCIMTLSTTVLMMCWWCVDVMRCWCICVLCNKLMERGVDVLTCAVLMCWCVDVAVHHNLQRETKIC